MNTRQSMATRAETAPARQERRGRRFLRLYWACLALAAAIWCALLVVVGDKDTIRLVDRPVEQAVQSVHLPLYGWVLTHASDLGYWPLSAVTYIVVFCALWGLRLRVEAVVGVASSLAADGVDGLVKIAVRRARPSPALVHVLIHAHGYSFPSGHVVHYTTLFGFAFFALWMARERSPLRTLALAVLGLLVVLVGPSRIYLGAHWPSDVLGAYCLSGLWLAGTIEAFLALKRHLRATWTQV